MRCSLTSLTQRDAGRRDGIPGLEIWVDEHRVRLTDALCQEDCASVAHVGSVASYPHCCTPLAPRLPAPHYVKLSGENWTRFLCWWECNKKPSPQPIRKSG